MCDEVVSAVASNENEGCGVMRLVLRRGLSVKVTKRVATSAAENEDCGLDLFELFFTRVHDRVTF